MATTLTDLEARVLVLEEGFYNLATQLDTLAPKRMLNGIDVLHQEQVSNLQTEIETLQSEVKALQAAIRSL